MGQAKARQDEMQRQAAHWVSVSKLLMHRFTKPGEKITITQEQMNALDQDYPKGHDMLCQGNGDGTITLSLVDTSEARRQLAADQAKRAGFKAPGRG